MPVIDDLEVYKEHEYTSRQVPSRKGSSSKVAFRNTGMANSALVVQDSLTNGNDFFVTESPNTVTASYFSAADILKN